MLPTIKDFIHTERKNKYTPPLTSFQIEQIMIKYGRLVVDECIKSIDKYKTTPSFLFEAVLKVKQEIQ